MFVFCMFTQFFCSLSHTSIVHIVFFFFNVSRLLHNIKYFLFVRNLGYFHNLSTKLHV